MSTTSLHLPSKVLAAFHRYRADRKRKGLSTPPLSHIVSDVLIHLVGPEYISLSDETLVRARRHSVAFTGVLLPRYELHDRQPASVAAQREYENTAQPAETEADPDGDRNYSDFA